MDQMQGTENIQMESRWNPIRSKLLKRKFLFLLKPNVQSAEKHVFPKTKSVFGALTVNKKHCFATV